MLFADADATQGATLFACVMAVASGLFAWLSVREKRLGDKDRLDADAEKVQMKADVATLKTDVADCREDRTGQLEMIRALRAAMERHAIECPPEPPPRVPK